MLRIIYTFTLTNEDGETSNHDFFNYTSGWEFARQEGRDYQAACEGRLTVIVNWKETVMDREYTIKPNGEIIWED